MNKLFFILLILPVFAQEISVVSSRPGAVWQPGETAVWNIKTAGAFENSFSWKLIQDGNRQCSEGKGELRNGEAQAGGALDEPGWLLIKLTFRISGGSETNILGGAVFAPEKIKPSLPAPADFNAFWQKKIQELNAIAINIQDQKPTEENGIEYFKITLDNIRGTKIYGQLAKPAGANNLPAIIQYQYAGVYPLKKETVINFAAKGYLAFNIMAHNLPCDQPPEFYIMQAKNELKDYVKQGWEDRENSYFLRMLLGAYRAADYISKRNDWNKKILIVTGTSQGGVQSFAAAALHPAVTALSVNVPAGSDFSAMQSEKSGGWPGWSNAPRDIFEKVLFTGNYFSGAYFAELIKCRAIVSVGLIDTTSPPSAVIGAYNMLKGKKELIIMPSAAHGGPGKEAYTAAFSALLEEFTDVNK